ncbi:MAG: hypothetical protein ACH350_09535, partial [Parachlamydiaceae bacterium]
MKTCFSLLPSIPSSFYFIRNPLSSLTRLDTKTIGVVLIALASCVACFAIIRRFCFNAKEIKKEALNRQDENIQKTITPLLSKQNQQVSNSEIIQETLPKVSSLTLVDNGLQNRPVSEKGSEKSDLSSHSSESHDEQDDDSNLELPVDRVNDLSHKDEKFVEKGSEKSD